MTTTHSQQPSFFAYSNGTALSIGTSLSKVLTIECIWFSADCGRLQNGQRLL